MKKTIRIHIECDERLEQDKCVAFINEGEYAKVLVSANSIGEAVKEIGVSICVMEHHLQSHTPQSSATFSKDSPYQGSAGAVKILKQLCELKRYKDTLGKDSFYEKRQPELWKLANDFLNGIADSTASPAGDGWVSVRDMPMEMFEASNEGRSETYNITYLYNGTPHVSCGYLLYENWHWLENNKPLSKGFAVTYYRELPTPPNKSV